MRAIGFRILKSAAVVVLAGLALASCAGVVPMKMTLPDPAASWQPALTNTEIAIIRQEFPSFLPELFAPGTDPTHRTALTSDNFAPAEFFGPANPQGIKATPYGISLETNGYDQSVPASLPSSGTYVGPTGADIPFTLGPTTEYPLNYLEGHVGTTLHNPNGSPLTIDLSKTRVDPSYVDTLMLELRDQFASVYPPIANIDPRSCKIVIESAVFFEHIGSNAPAITDGYTSGIGGNPGPITIHVALFYITADGHVYNWADSLIAQAVQFYMSAANLTSPPTPQFLAWTGPQSQKGVRGVFPSAIVALAKDLPRRFDDTERVGIRSRNWAQQFDRGTVAMFSSPCHPSAQIAGRAANIPHTFRRTARSSLSSRAIATRASTAHARATIHSRCVPASKLCSSRGIGDT